MFAGLQTSFCPLHGTAISSPMCRSASKSPSELMAAVATLMSLVSSVMSCRITCYRSAHVSRQVAALRYTACSLQYYADNCSI